MTIRPPRRVDLHHPQGFPQPQSPRLYRNIAVSFLVLAVMVVGLAVWMSSARASVTVRAKQDAQTLDTAVEIAKQPSVGQLQGRVVEGTFDNIQEFTVKGDGSVAAASTTASAAQTALPAVAATGTDAGAAGQYLGGRVRIVNKYSKSQTLVKTTRLLTQDGKLYRIGATVTVPSNQSVEVDAYADQPGADVAVPVGAHFTIPGLWIDLQKWIYAESVNAFAPTNRTAPKVQPTTVPKPVALSATPKPVATTADIEGANAALQNTVVEQARKTLLAEAGIPADKIGEACTGENGCWEAVYVVLPLEKKANVVVGQQTDRFLAQVKVKVTAVYYPRKDMALLVQSKLKERLPEGRDILSVDPQNVEYKLDATDPAKEFAQLHVTVHATSRLSPQDVRLSKDVIAGLPVDDAKRRLMAVDGVEDVTVEMHPSWARTVPADRQKIELKIQ